MGALGVWAEVCTAELCCMGSVRGQRDTMFPLRIIRLVSPLELLLLSSVTTFLCLSLSSLVMSVTKYTCLNSLLERE